MSTESRVVAPQMKIGTRPPAGSAASAEAPPAKGGKKKIMMIGAAVALVALVAAYWFLAGPGKAAAVAADGTDVSAPAEPAYELGEVLVIEPISINLQGGHYLRLGLGLQLVKGVAAPPETAKALDAAIAQFSGLTTDQLADLEFREQLKTQLGETLKELYEEEVVGVYYTDFVTQ